MTAGDLAAVDYYELLGVRASATQEQIKAAYRRQALKHHPDKNHADDAADRFARLTEAYRILSDPARRSDYDLDRGGSTVQALAKEIIDDVLGTRLRQRRPGQDVRYTLRLTLREVVSGTTRRINVAVPTTCSGCAGSGAAPGGARQCPTCRGRGEIRGGGFLALSRVCARCGGQGITIAKACTRCAGVGTVDESRRYTVQLPAGVRRGDVKIIEGEGAPGEGGGAPGDLHVVVEVAPHPVLQEEGDDVVVEVPVSLAMLALGGTVDVPTLEGRARMKVPPGTQSGRVFRLRGKGLPRARGRGDQLVRLQVETPVGLDDAAEQQLRDFVAACEARCFPLQAEFRRQLEDASDEL